MRSLIFFKKSFYLTCFCILRHEIFLQFFHVLFHFIREFKFPITAPVNLHRLRPHLSKISSGFLFICQNMCCCSFGMNQHRGKPSVSSPVHRKKFQIVGRTTEDTLSRSVFRMCFIRNFIGFLLPAQERFDFLYTFCIRLCKHFCHFNNPVPL